MASFMKIAVIMVQLCPLLLAVDCKSHPALCTADETSLIQIKQTIEHRQPTDTTVITKVETETVSADQPANFTFEQSSVEEAQDDWKAAASNTSIQKYAFSVARVNKARSIWEHAKARLKLQGATTKTVAAERAAHNAFIAATDESQAWQSAMDAEQDAAVKAAVAEGDSDAKHEAAQDANAAAAAAHKARQDAETASQETKIVQQSMVDDAAAEASATYAHAAKVAAAQAAATARQAEEDANVKRLAEKQQAQLAWKSERAAVRNEFKAHSWGMKAQQAAMAAAAAGVNIEIANLTASMANVSLIELKQPTVNTVTTVTNTESSINTVSENDTGLEAIMANASAAVNKAEELVSEKASDEKKADSAQFVANYAAQKASWARKSAEGHADSAWRKAEAASARAAYMARIARETEEAVKEADFELSNANATDMTALARANVSENVTYQYAASLRAAKAAQAKAKANLTAVTKAAQQAKIVEDALATEASATAASDIAAATRVVADYNQYQKVNADAAYENATDYLKLANENRAAQVKDSNSAESRAAHAALQAQNWDAKAAALTNQSASNASLNTMSEVTVTKVSSSMSMPPLQ